MNDVPPRADFVTAYCNAINGAAVIVETAFRVRGFEVGALDNDLLHLAVGTNDGIKFQETGDKKLNLPDTREPVVRAAKALLALRAALRDCSKMQELRLPSDRLNVASSFLSELRDRLYPDDLFEPIKEGIAAANVALRTGVRRRRGRPPELVYDAFVSGMIAEAIKAGMISSAAEAQTSFRAQFIEILRECEELLPLDLRAKDNSVISDRLDAAISRRRKKG